ncbi:MAG: hypothetical protein WBE44_14895 [Terriglobales bacterium]
MKVSAMEREPQRLTFGRIIRRLPLYFGLAFAGLAFVTLVVALSIHFGLTGYLTGGWIGFVGYTGLLFWIVVRTAKPHWHRSNFWFVTLAMLTAHCSTFIAILRVYPQWRMIWFWPITVVEAGVIGATLEWLFPEHHGRHGKTLKGTPLGRA